MKGLSWSSDRNNLPPENGLRCASVHDLIAAQIASGSLLPGDRLSSVRRAAVEHQVSRDTILRAYDRLVARGLIRALRGSGYYVAEKSPQVSGAHTDQLPVLAFRASDWRLLIDPSIPIDRRPGCGILRVPVDSEAEITRLTRAVAANHAPFTTHREELLGYRPLREQLQAKFATEGVPCSAQQIMTAPSATAALNIIVRTIAREAMPVMVEDPGPFIHSQILLSQGVRLHNVPRDRDGPDIAFVRYLCERVAPKLFLLSSVLQNPTGGGIAPHRAFELLKLADEFDFIIVDDCSDSDLGPPERDQTALAKLDVLNRVVHVGGFSKMMGPGTGIGFVAAGSQLMRLFELFRSVHGIGSSLHSQRIVYRCLGEGLYRRRSERLRAHLRRSRQQTMSRMVKQGLDARMSGHGLYLWVDLGSGIDATDVAQRMLERGFVTASARHFSTQRTLMSHMRFNVTTTGDEAISVLAEVLARG